MNDLINARCGWAGTDELYVKYHDEEWGKPVDDDRILFEFLVLESAQAGLSWITILRKREGYRKAFHRFDPERVAQMTPEYSYSFAKDKMGLSTLVSSYKTTNGEELSDVNLWALALGSLTRGVTVRAMTAAYAAFANEGVWREARTYTVVKLSLIHI